MNRLPLLWLSCSFLAGLAIGLGFPLQGIPPGIIWALAGGLFLLSLAGWAWARPVFYAPGWQKICPLPGLLLLAAALAGLARQSMAQAPWGPGDAGWYTGQEVQLVGRLAAVPDCDLSHCNLIFEAQTLGSGSEERPLRGKVLVSASRYTSWAPGDLAELTGRLQLPPAGKDMSYRETLYRQGIQGAFSFPQLRRLGQQNNFLQAAALALRQVSQKVTRRLFPAPEAGVLAGILLGDESDLSPALVYAFRQSGASHLLVVSGFNIAVISGLFLSLLTRFWGRWWGLLAALAAITFYVLLVGGSPPVARAALMGGLAMLGHGIGRRAVGLNLLAFSAAILCAFEPQLLADLSFQLSFGATLGLVILAGPLQSGLEAWILTRSGGLAGAAQPWLRTLGEMLLVSLAAQLATFPILLDTFERFSLVSFISNPLVLPVQPLLMTLGGIAVGLGALGEGAGQLAAWLALPFNALATLAAAFAWPLAAYTVRIVEWSARLPGAEIWVGKLPVPLTPWVFAGLLAWAFRSLLPSVTLTVPKGPAPAWLPRAALAGAALGCAVLWQNDVSLPNGRLQASVFSCQGEAALLLRLPDGKNVMLGSCPDHLALSQWLGQKLPLLNRQIDAWVLTAASSADIEGVAGVAQRLPVDRFFWAGAEPAGRSQQRLQDAVLSHSGRPFTSSVLASGSQIELSPGLALLAPRVEEEGAALRLLWGALDLYVPGGLPPEEPPPGWWLLSAADSSNLPEWSQQNPQLAIVTARAARPDGAADSWILLTHGQWLDFESDGQQAWLSLGGQGAR